MLVTAFLGVLQIWVMYTTMVMGFVWQPYLRDSILPFIIGIQEFLLISLIGEEFSVWWLYVLASVFATANWVMHNSLKRARQEPQNAQFFANLQPATLRDFLPAISIISVFLILGIIVSITGNRSWLPLGAIVIAIVVLMVQIRGVRKLWRSLMGMAL